MIKQAYLFIFILLGIGLTGCQDSDNLIDNPGIADGKMVEITIATTVPAITVQTKAEATTNEKTLEHVDILVFKEVGENENKTQHFAYRTQNTNDLAGDNTTVNIKTKLKISEEGEKYSIVLIANLKEEVENYFRDWEDDKVITKEKLLKDLTFIQDKKWLKENDEFKALPMSGKSAEAIEIKSDGSTFFDTINLLRSMARVELSVLDEINEADYFTIKSVKIYNARKEGLAVPYADNLENGIAIAPSLSGNTELISVNNMEYTATNNQVTGIYVNETANRNNNNEETETPLFLIIEAVYDKENEGHNKSTFYKIGFYNKTNDPVDILRNFTYNMTITKVEGPGDESEEDAIKNKPKNLTVSMTDWSDGEMKCVVFNGQYYLAVSESTMNIPMEAATKNFIVKTNYPRGWVAKVTQGEAWLNGISPATFNGIPENEKITLNYDVTLNGSGKARTGIISITCENQLTLDVYINQNHESAPYLFIEIKKDNNYIELTEDLVFRSGYYPRSTIDARELRAEWRPTGDDLNLYADIALFQWGTGTQNLKTKYTGGTSGSIIVEPSVMSDLNVMDQILTENVRNSVLFPVRETDVLVWVGQEQTTVKWIKLRQEHRDLYTIHDPSYKMDGEKHTFKVRSNTNWRAVPAGSNPAGVLTIHTTHGVSNPEEWIDFEFTLAENHTEEGTATINFIFDDQGIDIVKPITIALYGEQETAGITTGDLANCYVLNPGGPGVSIPVRQANRGRMASMGMKQIGESTELEYKFIWTDNSKGFSPEGAVSRVEIVGEGYNANMIVYPGSGEGNAVVAVVDKNDGTLYWSWHLWVVKDFNPYEDQDDYYQFNHYQYLDRNLGALTAVSEGGDPDKALGLYYQWGRKDPFPAKAGVDRSDFATVYDANGNTLERVNERRNVYEVDALIYAIENPRVFINNAGNSWVNPTWSPDPNIHYMYRRFWSQFSEGGQLAESTKGIFDPCPDGWKTNPNDITNNNGIWYNMNSRTSYNNATKSSTVEGLGIWPHAGRIDGDTGTIMDDGTGRYWTGNKDEWGTALGIHVWFKNGEAHAGQQMQDTHGLTIRCMRRVDDVKY